jgi:hypothetical protein
MYASKRHQLHAAMLSHCPLAVSAIFESLLETHLQV